jgi:cytochrome c553
MTKFFTPLAVVSLAAIAALGSAAFAQTAGNPAAGAQGAQIASRGTENGVAACLSCHGANGEGNAAANIPRLAGQAQAYLARQLHSYANGSRANPVMEPIAKGLTPQQIDAVAAYYAGLSAPAAKPPALSEQAQKRGQQLAAVGDDKLGVQGCANCHGPGGVGEPPSYPYLASQHRTYLIAALTEWKNGSRNTDPSMQMTMIAKRLSDSDIAALAAYYAAQPAPAPESLRMNVPAGSTERPMSAGAAADNRGTPAKGIGTEQGASTSGGGQGPGGGGAASGSGPSGTRK